MEMYIDCKLVESLTVGDQRGKIDSTGEIVLGTQEPGDRTVAVSPFK